VCVPLPAQQPKAKGPASQETPTQVPVSFAPQSLWYPGQGQGPAAWSVPDGGGKPTYASVLADLEARIRATARAGETVFTLVYGLVSLALDVKVILTPPCVIISLVILYTL
jgi:hypothetical protein